MLLLVLLLLRYSSSYKSFSCLVFPVLLVLIEGTLFLSLPLVAVAIAVILVFPVACC